MPPHADDEGDAPDVPDRKCARHHGHEALSLVLADVAGAKRELGARQEQDHTEDARRKQDAGECQPSR